MSGTEDRLEVGWVCLTPLAPALAHDGAGVVRAAALGLVTGLVANLVVSSCLVPFGEALFGVGVFLHFAADMQKHVALELRPGHLIDDKLFARLRNPNYLGELLIHGSFALLSQHWAPWAVLAFAFAIEWLPNMIRKDRSLSRYPSFAEYSKRSGMLTPWV